MFLYFMEVCIYKAPLSLFEGQTLFHSYFIDLVTHIEIFLLSMYSMQEIIAILTFGF